MPRKKIRYAGNPPRTKIIDGKFYKYYGMRGTKKEAKQYIKALKPYHSSIRNIKYKNQYTIYVH